jgi:hypothetical protein
MEVAILLMGVAVWWYRPTKWRKPTYEEAYPLTEAAPTETPENLAAEVVEESTPEGRVKMKRKGETFEYWAPRAMAYRYLEPVARKHVLLYGGDYVPLEKAVVREVVDDAPSVFAKLKSHKRTEVSKTINKYRWMGKEKVVVERAEPKAVSFKDYKK